MKTWLVIATSLYAVGLLPSLGLIVIAPMLFDAPGSENSIPLWIVLNCIVMLPVLILVSIAGMWIWYKKGAKKISTAFSLLPFADIVVLTLAYLVAVLRG